MKVMCLISGNQSMDRPNVIIGNEYTVTDYTYGWEMMHPKTGDVFYQLAEMNEDQRFWSGLFTQIFEESESFNDKNLINEDIFYRHPQ